MNRFETEQSETKNAVRRSSVFKYFRVHIKIMLVMQKFTETFHFENDLGSLEFTMAT